MANWIGAARTNYFKVRDQEKFKIYMDRIAVEVVEKDGHFALLATTDDGGFPTSVALYDSEGNELEHEDYVELYIVDYVSEHLADGEVAVFMEVGNEKLRYLTGWATAVNNTGKQTRIDLSDIYTQAEALYGVAPTNAHR